jgi:hypothetical protein
MVFSFSESEGEPADRFPSIHATSILLADAVRGGRQLAQLPPGASQLVVRAYTLGHVAQDHGEELPAALDVLGDRRFDGKFLAVGPQTVEDPGITHAPRGRAGMAELRDMPPVGGAEPLRQQRVEGLPEHGGARPAEQLLGGGVVQDDPLRIVDRNDGVHRRFHDVADLRLDALQLGVGRSMLVGLPVEEHGGEQHHQGADDHGDRVHLVAVETEQAGDQGEQHGEDTQRQDRPEDDEEPAVGEPAMVQCVAAHSCPDLTHVKLPGQAGSIVTHERCFHRAGSRSGRAA